MTIRFILYDSNEVSPIYTFPYVQYSNYPQTIKKFSEIEGIRGIGSITVEGSEGAWNLIIRGVLRGDGWDYEDVTSAIDALETALPFAQPFYVKIDKIEGGASVYSYKVKRLQPIEYGEGLRNGKKRQTYTVTLRVNSW